MSRYQDAKARTRQIVESTDSLEGRFFDLFIQATIFVTLVAYSLETLPRINDAQRATLIAIERISIVIFTLNLLKIVDFQLRSLNDLKLLRKPSYVY